MFIFKYIDRGLAELTRGLIYMYQATISPDHGWGRWLVPTNGCRFYPSCSVYSRQALTQYGFVIGLIKSFKRLGRCHPWQDGGYDPLV